MSKKESMKTITLDEYLAQMRAQSVPFEHVAFRCPMCGTIQSATDFFNAGAGSNMDEVEKWLGYSCIGRFTGAGPHKNTNKPGRGCDWTLGGLFRIHKLEVEREGEKYPRFEVATPEEAKAHMLSHVARQAS